MSAVVFEHVPVVELLERWRAQLAKPSGALVTARIEEEPPAALQPRRFAQ
jgi:2-polyprenyl-3-methyl-5-hydroxy-6-metoxy-1,4-benzoquinol methylase